MEPTVAAGQYDLRGLRIDLLRSAAEIYVRLAYPPGNPPEVVARRMVWREDCTADVLLKEPPVRARRQGPRSAVPDLRVAARQPPLPTHEAPDRGLAQRRRFSRSRSTRTTR